MSIHRKCFRVCPGPAHIQGNIILLLENFRDSQKAQLHLGALHVIGVVGVKIHAAQGGLGFCVVMQHPVIPHGPVQQLVIHLGEFLVELQPGDNIHVPA